MIMKKYFKYFTTVVVLFALGAAFMANTHKTNTNTNTKAENPPPCWIEVPISLTGECVNYNQNTEYIVNMKIYNTCNNPSTLLFDDTQHFSTESSDPLIFCISDTICTTDIVEDCFQVITTVAKVSKSNGEIFCSGQSSGSYNCSDLMDLANLGIPVVLH